MIDWNSVEESRLCREQIQKRHIGHFCFCESRIRIRANQRSSAQQAISCVSDVSGGRKRFRTSIVGLTLIVVDDRTINTSKQGAAPSAGGEKSGWLG